MPTVAVACAVLKQGAPPWHKPCDSSDQIKLPIPFRKPVCWCLRKFWQYVALRIWFATTLDPLHGRVRVFDICIAIAGQFRRGSAT